MAFDRTKLSLNVENRNHREFSYRDNAVDALAAITAADFFADLQNTGAEVNDPVYVEGTDGAAWHRVDSFNAAGDGTIVAL